jgi:hypothetical protein
MAAETSPKDTIYVDVDDEITGIIDKLRVSEGKIVALVLPKRASVFQSIVNMKLLKRAADDDKKHLVLITTESGLMPLAGLAGVHVASTLTSKPEVPAAPQAFDDREETVDEATGEPEELDAAAAAATPIGDLAGIGAAAAAADEVETIEMSDIDDADAAALTPDAPTATGKKASKKPKAKKDKKLSVPNFERFRLLIVLGVVLLVVLGVGAFFAASILPKASITVTTDATNVNVNLNLTADSKVNTFNASTHTLPAKLVQQQKTYSQAIATTGQKNNGTKATGTVVFYDCDKNDRLTATTPVIPAGTGITSGGLTYVTQESATVPPSSYNVSGACRKDTASNSIPVTAQAGGANYNTASSVSFSVSYSNPDGTNSFSATSADGVTGGTDNITKIVSQSDIDNAQSKITTSDATVKQALENQLTAAGLYAVVGTYNAGTPVVTTSANVGDTADNVTVTEAITYTMLGVQQTDLKSLIDTNVKSQIDTSKQGILSEGLQGATFNVTTNNGTNAQMSLQAVATAGPELSTDTIKQTAAGKKSGEVETELKANPDVTDVTIKLSPFWVTTVPKKSSKVTVTIAKPATTATSSSNGSKP